VQIALSRLVFFPQADWAEALRKLALHTRVKVTKILHITADVAGHHQRRAKAAALATAIVTLAAAGS
jgi:hypothetical protein